MLSRRRIAGNRLEFGRLPTIYAMLLRPTATSLAPEQSTDRFDRTTHFSCAWFLEKDHVAVLPEAVVPQVILARVLAARITRHLAQGDRGVRPFQEHDTRLRGEESGSNQCIKPGATKRQGAFGESVWILGSHNGRALA